MDTLSIILLAKIDFSTAQLRQETGAVINESEIVWIDKTYFPQFGDDQQTILNKRKNVLLKVDIEGAEYKILKDILSNFKKINCLIIEFHSVRENLDKIYNFVDKIKNLKL
mgnify:CR=1 FL=1